MRTLSLLLVRSNNLAKRIALSDAISMFPLSFKKMMDPSFDEMVFPLRKYKILYRIHPAKTVRFRNLLKMDEK